MWSWGGDGRKQETESGENALPGAELLNAPEHATCRLRAPDFAATLMAARAFIQRDCGRGILKNSAPAHYQLTPGRPRDILTAFALESCGNSPEMINSWKIPESGLPDMQRIRNAVTICHALARKQMIDKKIRKAGIQRMRQANTYIMAS